MVRTEFEERPVSQTPTVESTLPAAWRVEIFRREGVGDPAASEALEAISEWSSGRATPVEPRGLRHGRGILLSPEIPEGAVPTIVEALLRDPVLEEARIYAPGESPEPPTPGRHRVLVARKPGVMDPEAVTIERAIARAALAQRSDGAAIQAATFDIYEIDGDLDGATLVEIGQRLFANEVIEDLRVAREDLPFGLEYGKGSREVLHVALREADDEQLLRISRDGVLSLNLVEMHGIQAYYRDAGREPTVCELETLAQTWSEHCKHKTFCGIIELECEDGSSETVDNLLKETIKRATVELDKEWCISVFHDNAGIIAFEGDWDVCFKVETHNHPSAIDPYGGAGTGIGGVIRDILGCGLGAKPIANTDCFFVGPLDLPRDELPKGCLHPRRILRGVVGGVRDYGNRMGIPTVAGGVWSDPRYVGNPLVYAGTVGLMPRWAAEKEVHPGDHIVVIGGRTGRDGIHGATFSSVELHDESVSDSSSSVQIGDPITEKRVLDALLRARDERLYRAVTDCGAGGLSSAVGEMGEACGAEVHLDRVPLKYPGLSSAEIWISEAQERMVFAVPPEHLGALMAICEEEDVEASDIGTFTDTGRLVLVDQGMVMGDLEMAFLHDGTPRPTRRAVDAPGRLEDPEIPAGTDASACLLGMLAHTDVGSKEWIIRQYDHEVQGTSVVKPLVGVEGDGPGNGSVIQPLADSRRGLAIGCGAHPRQGRLDAGSMALASIDEALRNVVAVGGDPNRTALLDNFSWGNCDRPEELGALVRASKACYRAAMAYGTPFISGKDSLNNEFRVGEETIVIPPTLLISALAQVPDVSTCVTMDAKAAGNRVYLVGTTAPEFGGSQLHEGLGLFGGLVPEPDLGTAPGVLTAMHAAIAAGHARSVHDLSDGGLAVAAAEMAFAGGLGIELDLGCVTLEEVRGDRGRAARNDHDASLVALFSESCTRFLCEVEPEHAAAFEAHFEGTPGTHPTPIGQTREERSLLARDPQGQTVLELSLDALRAAHRGGFQG